MTFLLPFTVVVRRLEYGVEYTQKKK